MPKIDINIEKIYNFPKEIKVVYYKNNILVISPLTANWIVLRSSIQLDIFNQLVSGRSIKEILCNPNFDNNDVTIVITQIEAKRFFRNKVHRITDEGQNMHLYLTNKCNLRCPHCYMFSGIANKDELSTPEVINLIQDYKNIAHGKYITLSGGEPSVRVDFDQIVQKASNLGLKVKLLTNGALMTNNRIAKIAKYLHSVQISIDGYSEETNATIRGMGHFQKALNAVDAFIAHGVETSIAITPSLDLLLKNPIGYVNFAKYLISKYKGKSFEVKFAEGLSTGRNINPSQKYNDEYAAIIKNIQKEIYGEHYDLIMFVEKMSNNIIFNNCMFGNFSVSSVGDVYFCPELGSLLPVANIRHSPFTEIFKESAIAEKATEISKLQPCNHCELMYICGGGCRIKEFPLLVNRRSFNNIDYTTIPPRSCSNKIKEMFYKFMIESNEYLYTYIR